MTLYTAVGILRNKNSAEGKYPQIAVNEKEHNVDMCEMLIWTILSWRILPMSEIEKMFHNRIAQLCVTPDMSLKAYVDRLISKGLIVSGAGETEADALYDLVGDLYIVPTESSFFTTALVFLKIVFVDRTPIKSAARVFNFGGRSENERRIMNIAKQALLSTAEIIKCVEIGCFDLSTDEKVMDALYDDNYTTCDNLFWTAKYFKSQRTVLTAVVNLYLNKQILLQRI